eukprot:Trichotokara_eunicae@DN563_c0_g1_i1.p1
MRERMIYCPKCEAYCKATVKTYPYRLPRKYLCVQLRRFVLENGVPVWNDTLIDVPEAFHTHQLIKHMGGSEYPTATSTIPWKLKGLTCRNIDTGHYYGVHSQRGVWKQFEDQIITNRRPDQVPKNEVYLLWYERGGSDKNIQKWNSKFSLPPRGSEHFFF